MTGSITGLLQAWGRGDPSALDKLAPLVYSELRRVAAAHLSREHSEHTLQPTELVHEVFLRLVGHEKPDFRNRAHFMAISSKYMRQILVDHARKRGREKRGGGSRPLTLELDSVSTPAPQVDLLMVDEALSALAEFDPRKSQILEMHFFGGMVQKEIAVAVGVHTNTTARDLRLARAWLQARLRA